MIIHKMKEAHGDAPDTALEGVGGRTSQNEQRLSQELSLAEKGRQISEKRILSKEESTWEEAPEARQNVGPSRNRKKFLEHRVWQVEQ